MEPQHGRVEDRVSQPDNVVPEPIPVSDPSVPTPHHTASVARQRTFSGRRIWFVAGAIVLLGATIGSLLLLAGPLRRLGAAPTATAGERVVATSPLTPMNGFRDSLATNTRDWYTGPYCYFAGGAYHINTGAQAGYRCLAPTMSLYADVDLQVTAQAVSGASTYLYGIVVRVVDNNSLYFFLASSAGTAEFGLKQNGTFRALSPRWTITQSAAYAPTTLRVVAHGPDFTCYVNGAKVGEVHDTSYLKGDVGLIVLGQQVDVAFTNFAVAGTQ